MNNKDNKIKNNIMKENKNAEWCLNEYEEYLKTMDNYFKFK